MFDCVLSHDVILRFIQVVLHLASQTVVQVLPHSAPVVAVLIVKMKNDYYIYSITRQGIPKKCA